jgi:hypothetical protein
VKYEKMKKSKLDKTAIGIEDLIEGEAGFTYGRFLSALRTVLGLTRQSVAYDLDLDYDDLCRHEDGKMSRRFDVHKNELIAEYYGVDPLLLEKKFREWQKGGYKADK